MNESSARNRIHEISNCVQSILNRFDDGKDSINDTMYHLLEMRLCMMHFIEENKDDLTDILYVKSMVMAYAIDRTMIKILEEDLLDIEDASGIELKKIVEKNIEDSINKQFEDFLGGDE